MSACKSTFRSLSDLIWKDLNKRLLGRARLKSGSYTCIPSWEKEEMFRVNSKCLNVLEISSVAEDADGTINNVKEYKIEESFREAYLLDDTTYKTQEEAGRARDLALLGRYDTVSEGREFSESSMLHYPRETYDEEIGIFEHQEARYQRIQKQSKGGWFFSDQMAYVSPVHQIDFIACGASHFCAVSAKSYGARLFTWGSNENGELGRATGKKKVDMNPGVVVFKSAINSSQGDGRQSEPDRNLSIMNNIDSLVSPNAMHQREVRVTSICCGLKFTVCSAIGEHDGQTSIYSWGWVPDRKSSQKSQVSIFGSKLTQTKSSNVANLLIRGAYPMTFQIGSHRKSCVFAQCYTVIFSIRWHWSIQWGSLQQSACTKI